MDRKLVLVVQAGGTAQSKAKSRSQWARIAAGWARATERQQPAGATLPGTARGHGWAWHSLGQPPQRCPGKACPSPKTCGVEQPLGSLHTLHGHKHWDPAPGSTMRCSSLGMEEALPPQAQQIHEQHHDQLLSLGFGGSNLQA